MSSGRVIKKGTKRERLFPYRYRRRGLEVELQSVVLDDDVQLQTARGNDRLVRLDTRSWKQVTLELSVHAPDDVLTDVLLETELGSPPVEFLVAHRCGATFVRDGVTCAANRGDGGVSGRIRVDIDRRISRGSIELTPYLVRTSDAESGEPGRATRRGARVASARPWVVRVDPKQQSKTAHLDINFVRFSKQERFKDYRDRVYWLHADAEKPILWLNQDHTKVVTALNNEGTTGLAARTRDVFFDLISSSVWIQLFVHAAASINDEGETTFDWHQGVLEEILPELFPEMDRISRRLAAKEQLARPGELSDLLRRVDLVLQGRHEYARHMRALVTEAWDS